MRDNEGCLEGLFKLFLLTAAFDWLQDRFGFGRGGCMGCGCGLVLLVIFLLLVCSTITGTDWTRLSIGGLF